MTTPPATRLGLPARRSPSSTSHPRPFRAVRSRRTLACLAAVSLVFVGACSNDGDAGGTSTTKPASKGTDEAPDWGDGAGVDPEADDAPTIEAPEGPAPDELEITDIKEGDGETITAGMFVEMRYVGALYANGTVFDSSYRRGEGFPVTIGAGRVIKGWDEGIVGMKVGGQRRLVIPADLAYGSDGSGDTIPADAALIFVVDALSAATPPTVEAQPDPGEEVAVTDIRAGTGPQAATGDSLSLMYVAATAADAKVFDSSWESGQPVSLPLDASAAESGNLTGLFEGLVGATAGSRRMIVIPGAKAFGAEGNADAGVPPNAAVVFVVDVLEISTPSDG